MPPKAAAPLAHRAAMPTRTAAPLGTAALPARVGMCWPATRRRPARLTLTRRRPKPLHWMLAQRCVQWTVAHAAATCSSSVSQGPSLCLQSKKPSRSARRKAAKRRQRRMGLVPRGRGQPASGPGALAERDMPRACNTQPPLPKAGRLLPTPSQQQQLHSGAAPDVTALHQYTATSDAPALQIQCDCEPMSQAEFGRLPLLVHLPAVGDVVAYRLLEIGIDLQPVVSEVRCGRCDGGQHFLAEGDGNIQLSSHTLQGCGAGHACSDCHTGTSSRSSSSPAQLSACPGQRPTSNQN